MAQTPNTNPHSPTDLTATMTPEVVEVMEGLFQSLAVNADSAEHFWLMVAEVPTRVEADDRMSAGFRAGFRDAWEAFVFSTVVDAVNADDTVAGTVRGGVSR